MTITGVSTGKPWPDATPGMTYYQVQSWPDGSPVSDHLRKPEAESIAAEYQASYQRPFRVVEKTIPGLPDSLPDSPTRPPSTANQKEEPAS